MYYWWLDLKNCLAAPLGWAVVFWPLVMFAVWLWLYATCLRDECRRGE